MNVIVYVNSALHRVERCHRTLSLPRELPKTRLLVRVGSYFQIAIPFPTAGIFAYALHHTNVPKVPVFFKVRKVWEKCWTYGNCCSLLFHTSPRKVWKVFLGCCQSRRVKLCDMIRITDMSYDNAFERLLHRPSTAFSNTVEKSYCVPTKVVPTVSFW